MTVPGEAFAAQVLQSSGRFGSEVRMGPDVHTVSGAAGVRGPENALPRRRGDRVPGLRQPERGRRRAFRAVDEQPVPVPGRKGRDLHPRSQWAGRDRPRRVLHDPPPVTVLVTPGRPGRGHHLGPVDEQVGQHRPRNVDPASGTALGNDRRQPEPPVDPNGNVVEYTTDPVSYTHLTLPT